MLFHLLGQLLVALQVEGGFDPLLIVDLPQIGLFVVDEHALVRLEVFDDVFVLLDAHCFARVELVLELLPVVELDEHDVAHPVCVDNPLIIVFV